MNNLYLEHYKQSAPGNLSKKVDDGPTIDGLVVIHPTAKIHPSAKVSSGNKLLLKPLANMTLSLSPSFV